MRVAASLIGLALTAAAPPLPPQSSGSAPPPLVTGLDHITLAVTNLDAAIADFQRLGFTLKPGRRHPGGTRRAHIEFPDRTELELITTTNPTSPLATEYATFLKSGDGPAFWSLRAPNLAALTSELTNRHLTPATDGQVTSFAQSAFPHRLFFADSAPSPFDKPAEFEHPNTAFHLQAVWLVAAQPERDLAVALGATRTGQPACGPFTGPAEIVSLARGEIMSGPIAPAFAQPRTIVAVTILVKDLTAAQTVLTRNNVPARQITGCGHASLWIAPADTHGTWLEFRQHPD